MSETAARLRKILEESRCQPNRGCDVATTCMCALAEDAIEALEALAASPAPAVGEDALRIELEQRREWQQKFYKALDDNQKVAEDIVRPHITSAAIFGVTPSHRFKDNAKPTDVVGDIATALAVRTVTAGEVERLRDALQIILANTEPDAIKHRDYDRLAKVICDCALAALAASTPALPPGDETR